MKRGLEWSDVRGILDAFPIKHEVGPYGFTMRATVMHGYRDTDKDWRIRCGSGIAGRGGHWTLVWVESGRAISSAIAAKNGLRRAIREQLATLSYGPRPPNRDGYVHYATWHRTRFGECFVWKSRRIKPSKKSER